MWTLYDYFIVVLMPIMVASCAFYSYRIRQEPVRARGWLLTALTCFGCFFHSIALLLSKRPGISCHLPYTSSVISSVLYGFVRVLPLPLPVSTWRCFLLQSLSSVSNCLDGSPSSLAGSPNLGPWPAL